MACALLAGPLVAAPGPPADASTVHIVFDYVRYDWDPARDPQPEGRGSRPPQETAVRWPRTILSTAIYSLLFLALPSSAPAVVAILEPLRDNTLFEDANGDTSNGAGP